MINSRTFTLRQRPGQSPKPHGIPYLIVLYKHLSGSQSEYLNNYRLLRPHINTVYLFPPQVCLKIIYVNQDIRLEDLPQYALGRITIR